MKNTIWGHFSTFVPSPCSKAKHNAFLVPFLSYMEISSIHQLFHYLRRECLLVTIQFMLVEQVVKSNFHKGFGVTNRMLQEL